MESAFALVCFVTGITFGFLYRSSSKRKKLEVKVKELSEEVELLQSKNSFLTGQSDHYKLSLNDSVNRRIEAEKKIVNLEVDLKKQTEESQELKEEINRMVIEINRYQKESQSNTRPQRKKNTIPLNK